MSYQEVYAWLGRYQSGAWATLAGGLVDSGPGGITIQGSTRYDCNHQTSYSYRTEAWGYAVLQGVGYFETQYKYANHVCPS